MKRIVLLSLLFATAAIAGDVLLKNDNANLGPVTSINCLRDGGIGCARDAGSVGTLYCQSANPVSTGCITPGAQTIGGVKSFASPIGLGNFAHGSLGVCSAGQVAYCTTHGSVTQCKDIGGGVFDWVDLNGSTGGGVTIANLAGGRLFFSLAGYLGTFTAPFAYTITSAKGIVSPGTGVAAIVNLRITDGTNNCDCPVHCDTGVIDACAGNCTVLAANTQMLAVANSDGCTTPVTLRSDITLSGYK